MYRREIRRDLVHSFLPFFFFVWLCVFFLFSFFFLLGSLFLFIVASDGG